MIALRSDSAINSTSIQSFLSKLGKKYCLKDIESILSKIDNMPGIRVKLPYLTESEWRKLIELKLKKEENSFSTARDLKRNCIEGFGHIISGFSSL